MGPLRKFCLDRSNGWLIGVLLLLVLHPSRPLLRQQPLHLAVARMLVKNPFREGGANDPAAVETYFAPWSQPLKQSLKGKLRYFRNTCSLQHYFFLDENNLPSGIEFQWLKTNPQASTSSFFLLHSLTRTADVVSSFVPSDAVSKHPQSRTATVSLDLSRGFASPESHTIPVVFTRQFAAFFVAPPPSLRPLLTIYVSDSFHGDTENAPRVPLVDDGTPVGNRQSAGAAQRRLGGADDEKASELPVGREGDSVACAAAARGLLGEDSGRRHVMLSSIACAESRRRDLEREKWGKVVAPSEEEEFLSLLKFKGGTGDVLSDLKLAHAFLDSYASVYAAEESETATLESGQESDASTSAGAAGSDSVSSASASVAAADASPTTASGVAGLWKQYFPFAGGKELPTPSAATVVLHGIHQDKKEVERKRDGSLLRWQAIEGLGEALDGIYRDCMLFKNRVLDWFQPWTFLTRMLPRVLFSRTPEDAPGLTAAPTSIATTSLVNSASRGGRATATETRVGSFHDFDENAALINAPENFVREERAAARTEEKGKLKKKRHPMDRVHSAPLSLATSSGDASASIAAPRNLSLAGTRDQPLFPVGGSSSLDGRDRRPQIDEAEAVIREEEDVKQKHARRGKKHRRMKRLYRPSVSGAMAETKSALAKNQQGDGVASEEMLHIQKSHPGEGRGRLDAGYKRLQRESRDLRKQTLATAGEVGYEAVESSLAEAVAGVGEESVAGPQEEAVQRGKSFPDEDAEEEEALPFFLRRLSLHSSASTASSSLDLASNGPLHVPGRVARRLMTAAADDTSSRQNAAPADTSSRQNAAPADTSSRQNAAPADTSSRQNAAPADTSSRQNAAPADTSSRQNAAPADMSSRQNAAADNASSRKPATKPKQEGSRNKMRRGRVGPNGDTRLWVPRTEPEFWLFDHCTDEEEVRRLVVAAGTVGVSAVIFTDVSFEIEKTTSPDRNTSAEKKPAYGRAYTKDGLAARQYNTNVPSAATVAVAANNIQAKASRRGGFPTELEMHLTVADSILEEMEDDLNSFMGSYVSGDSGDGVNADNSTPSGKRKSTSQRFSSSTQIPSTSASVVLSIPDTEFTRNFKRQLQRNFTEEVVLDMLQADFVDCRLLQAATWSFFAVQAPWVVLTLALVYSGLKEQLGRGMNTHAHHAVLLPVAAKTAVVIAAFALYVQCPDFASALSQQLVTGYFCFNILFHGTLYGALALCACGIVHTKQVLSKMEILGFFVLVGATVPIIAFYQLMETRMLPALLALYALALGIVVVSTLNTIRRLQVRLLYVQLTRLTEAEQAVTTKLQMYKRFLCTSVIFFVLMSVEKLFFLLLLKREDLSGVVAAVIEWIYLAALTIIFRYPLSVPELFTQEEGFGSEGILPMYTAGPLFNEAGKWRESAGKDGIGEEKDTPRCTQHLCNEDAADCSTSTSAEGAAAERRGLAVRLNNCISSRRFWKRRSPAPTDRVNQRNQLRVVDTAYPVVIVNPAPEEETKAALAETQKTSNHCPLVFHNVAIGMLVAEADEGQQQDDLGATGKNIHNACQALRIMKP